MSKISVALNIRFIKPEKLDGIGLYSYHITKRLIELCPEIDFHLISDGSAQPEFTQFKNVQWVKLFPPCRIPMLYYQWVKSLTGYLERNAIDIYIAFDGTLPNKGGYKTKLISVIHDLNFIFNPSWAPGKWGEVHKKNAIKSIENADKIITVSEFSKNEIISFFKVEPNLIEVIPNASRFIRQPKKLNQPLILWVGSVSPRKNVENLLAAFMQFKNAFPDSPDLLLSGRFYKGSKSILKPYTQAIKNGHIRIAGRLTDQELGALLHQSLFLVNPSLYEGFGLPLVEAMSCGLPIACSNIEPFKEVCDNAAIYFDPNNPQDIAESFSVLWQNPDLREKLSLAGLQQNTKYSWHESALKYQALLNEFKNVIV
jgi:glycosyltransferase involved in cell wall biosynthesis